MPGGLESYFQNQIHAGKWISKIAVWPSTASGSPAAWGPEVKDQNTFLEQPKCSRVLSGILV
jgi:hypothetical protein